MCQRANTRGSLTTTMSYLAARVLQAILGVTSLDQQPAPASRPRQRGVLEADHDPAPREAVAVEEVRPPTAPRQDGRVRASAPPTSDPPLEDQYEL